MTKNKEINIFSVSFLDLLSGALGAIIILFIIIPKATNKNSEAAQTIQRIDSLVNELTELNESAQGSIPRNIYEQIMNDLQQLKENLAQLQAQTENIQRQLQDAQRTNETLRQQLEQTVAQLQEVQNQIQSTRGGISDKFFGINASLGIVCTWNEDLDVDLWLKNSLTDEWCFYNNPTTEFGTLSEDLTRRNRTDDFYELIYQRTLKPGNYEIWVHLYTEGTSATFSGYIVLFPGKTNEKRISYGPMKIRSTERNNYPPPKGGGKKVGNLIIKSNDIILN